MLNSNRDVNVDVKCERAFILALVLRKWCSVWNCLLHSLSKSTSDRNYSTNNYKSTKAHGIFNVLMNRNFIDIYVVERKFTFLNKVANIADKRITDQESESFTRQ